MTADLEGLPEVEDEEICKIAMEQYGMLADMHRKKLRAQWVEYVPWATLRGVWGGGQGR